MPSPYYYTDPPDTDCPVCFGQGCKGDEECKKCNGTGERIEVEGFDFAWIERGEEE